MKKKLPVTKIFTCYCKNNKCTYRKPNIGMIIKATQIHNLDLSKSFIIGDRWRDIDMGLKIGCKTIFIDKEYNEKLNYHPNYSIKFFFELKKIFEL